MISPLNILNYKRIQFIHHKVGKSSSFNMTLDPFLPLTPCPLASFGAYYTLLACFFWPNPTNSRFFSSMATL